MLNNDNPEKAIELIGKSNSILVTTHTKPDGDACGCIVAVSEILGALGKKVKALMLSPVPEWYDFLFTEKVPVLSEDISLEQLMEGLFGEFDLIMVVDTNSYDQLPQFGQYLKQADKPVLVIDHHVTADGLGDVELTDSTAAAAGLIIFDLLKYADWPITKKIAEAIFVAIATDTGWLQFSNTDSRVFNCCAELIETGIRPTELYEKLYHTFTHKRFRLMVAMLNSLELHFNGRYASQHILQSDFEKTGALYEDTENLINECHRIESVKLSALFVELKDGRIKCSLRSKDSIDVSKIATKFGGGGHKMAAGTFLPGPLENAKQLILKQIKQSEGI